MQTKFPQIAGFKAFHVPASRLAEVPAALKGQIAVDAKDAGGILVDATGLQIQGVLDDLYTYNGALGGRPSAPATRRRCASGRPRRGRSISACSPTPTPPRRPRCNP